MLSEISVRNSTGSSIFLSRIGLSIPASSTMNISNYAYEHEIKTDNSLLSGIQNNNLFLIIDNTELTKSEALRFFTVEISPPVSSLRVLSDSNQVSLSGIPGSSIDGITLISGDSILLTNQTNNIENGPWIINASTWRRPPGYKEGSSISGAIFSILEGTTYSETLWICNSAEGADIIGTNNLFFFQKTSLSSTGNEIKSFTKFMIVYPLKEFNPPDDIFSIASYTKV